ncbi:MAG: VOC family protein [Candidatus Sumerlaeota bacterium]|nr:VOC family protein [Candidatus Sumerlaeota bacterium]
MITGLAHACFTVRNLEASIQFYKDQLGFTHAFDFVKDKNWRFGVYLSIGGRNFIELFEGEVEPAAPKQSYKHICLEVDSIENTVMELRARGVEVTDPKLGMDHSWQAWLSDPDGNRIELHCYTPESWQTPFLK